MQRSLLEVSWNPRPGPGGEGAEDPDATGPDFHPVLQDKENVSELEAVMKKQKEENGKRGGNRSLLIPFPPFHSKF